MHRDRLQAEEESERRRENQTIDPQIGLHNQLIA